jgi:hypothetical protein
MIYHHSYAIFSHYLIKWMVGGFGFSIRFDKNEMGKNDEIYGKS